MRVLVAEDDPIIASRVAASLEQEGFETVIRYDGAEALDAIRILDFGLVVLDVMMPKLTGVEVCRTMRQGGNRTPVIMLTAKDTVDDRVDGLDAGADDYLVKPFDVRELLARVRALVRRDWVQRTGILKIGDLELDTQSHLAHRAGVELKLTRKEYELLEVLARNAGRIVTRQVLMDTLYNNDDRTENTLNFHVASLRKKLDAGHAQKLIHTMHGLGYSVRNLGDDT